MQGKKVSQEKLFNDFRLSDRLAQTNFYRRLKKYFIQIFCIKRQKPIMAVVVKKVLTQQFSLNCVQLGIQRILSVIVKLLNTPLYDWICYIFQAMILMKSFRGILQSAGHDRQYKKVVLKRLKTHHFLKNYRLVQRLPVLAVVFSNSSVSFQFC